MHGFSYLVDRAPSSSVGNTVRLPVSPSNQSPWISCDSHRRQNKGEKRLCLKLHSTNGVLYTFGRTIVKLYGTLQYYCHAGVTYYIYIIFAFRFYREIYVNMKCKSDFTCHATNRVDSREYYCILFRRRAFYLKQF